MAATPPDTVAELRARYRASSEALEQAWTEELFALSDEEALERTLALELFAEEAMPSRQESGLIEQQALFRLATPR